MLQRLSVGFNHMIDEVGRKNHDLAAAVVRAEAANRAKSEFLANMSHELRTPLNAIHGFAEMMREEMFGPSPNGRYKSYAGDISDSSAHLIKVITDILDLSKAESGRPPCPRPHHRRGKATAVAACATPLIRAASSRVAGPRSLSALSTR